MESLCNECNECRESVTMKARVLRVCCCCELLVCDLCSCQEFRVHTDKACCFQPGQCVCITYSGAATMSIPPQINAECIELLNNNGNSGCCCC